MPISRQAIALLALVVVLSGCAAPVAAKPVDVDHVQMPPSYRFDPPAIRVPVGTTVVWHNADNFTHSVHLLDGSNVDRVAHPGESVSIRFDRTGLFRYDCSFHSQQMKGEVEVVSR